MLNFKKWLKRLKNRYVVDDDVSEVYAELERRNTDPNIYPRRRYVTDADGTRREENDNEFRARIFGDE